MVGGEVEPFGMLVWSTGLSPNPLINELQGQVKLEGGKIVVDDHLRVLHPSGRQVLANVCSACGKVGV